MTLLTNMLPTTSRPRWFALSLAVAASVALTGCDRLPEQLGGEPEPTETPVAADGPSDAAPTVSAAVRRTVTADGRLVQPRPEQQLSFRTAGILDELLVREGQEVVADETLATIETMSLDLAVADARSALASAQSSLGKLETGTSLETARLEVERAKNTLWGSQAQRDSICGAVERGMAEEASCDNAQAAVQAGEQAVQIAEQNLRQLEETIDGDIASARAGVARSSLALQEATTNRDSAVLTAPFTGTVSAVHVLPGVDVGPGSPVVTLNPSGSLQFVTTNLSERYVGDVRRGAPAEILLTAFPDYPMDAVVSRVAPQGSEDASGAVVYSVYLDLAETDLPILAGMTGRAEIDVLTDER